MVWVKLNDGVCLENPPKNLSGLLDTLAFYFEQYMKQVVTSTIFRTPLLIEIRE